MPTFKINENRVKVTDDNGSSLRVDVSHPNYEDACEAALYANWELFRDLALEEIDELEDDEPMIGMVCGIATSIEDMANQIHSATGIDILERDLDELEDDIDRIEEILDDVSDEHDLSNWNGSPIYYLTKEQALEQVSKSCGFWAYHDFGVGARCGRRYATVPTGFGPTAPDGYEWACVSIEE